MGLDTKTYWLTDRQSQHDFDFDFVSSEPIGTGSREEYKKSACEDFMCAIVEWYWDRVS
jgi:hypothetical protein